VTYYQEIQPGERLKQFVKCYYCSGTSSDVLFEDTAYATGCIELMFNLGEGKWQTNSGNGFITTPPIELWGQVIRPLTFRAFGKNTMLGVRFFPHTAFLFIDEVIERLNDKVSDLSLIEGDNIRALHSKLFEAASLADRVELLEEFLTAKLNRSEKKIKKFDLVNDVINELKKDDFFDKLDKVASRYGITSRYLQKLFLQHTGLTPKLYSKINRFQNSLVLIAQKSASLTSIAYECGYFDQSHFIRDFKSFTGKLLLHLTLRILPHCSLHQIKSISKNLPAYLSPFATAKV
jgi:AraC-like DNA-binding protein